MYKLIIINIFFAFIFAVVNLPSLIGSQGITDTLIWYTATAFICFLLLLLIRALFLIVLTKNVKMQKEGFT